MRVLCASLVLLAGLAAPALAGEVTAEEIERDLRLSAWLTSEATIVPGEPVRVGARIRNHSESRAYALVRPGDGSESGWREPHVFFAAVWRSPRDGGVPVEEKAGGRCGLHDADWQRAVVTLAPGEQLDLTMHLTAASTFLDFQREGRTEIRVHYRFSAGRTHRGGPGAAEGIDLGAMRGVPPFELVSDPVALHVIRPVDVTATAVGTLRVGEGGMLADLLRVVVRNRSGERLDFGPQQVLFEIGPADSADLLDLREEEEPRARVRAAPLRIGDESVFAGPTAFRLLRHLRLRARAAGTLQVAAVYAPGAHDRGPDRSPVRIRSPWVTISVEPAAGSRAPQALTTVAYRAAPERRFFIPGTAPEGVSPAGLVRVLEQLRRREPTAAYEVTSEVKLTPHEVDRIRDDFRRSGVPLRHLWVPVGDTPEGDAGVGPHGPGYVDLLD